MRENKTRYLKKCIICGKEFFAKLDKALFCSPACQVPYQNSKRKGKGKTHTCLECGEIFIRYGEASFCSKSCLAKNKMKRPEYRAKLFTEDFSRKASERMKLYMKNHPEIAKAASERMKINNPSQKATVQEKIRTTKIKNGTLDIIKYHKGGNGHYTKMQMLLYKNIGGCLEYPISLGKRQQNYPTCYKVDIGFPEIKLAIEVDGATHLTKKQKEKDLKKELKLTSLGWKVLRFSNLQVMNNLDGVILQIMNMKKALSITMI